MKYLLDTNVCIDVLKGRPDVVKRFKKCSPSEVGLSVITTFELIQGAHRAPSSYRASEELKVGKFLSLIGTLPFDTKCAALAAEINADLLNAGTPVGVMDVFISATALVAGLPVVTGNRKDFSRIKGLKIINWRQ